MEWKKFKALEMKAPNELVKELTEGFIEATNGLVEMKLLKKSDLDKISSRLKCQFEFDLVIFSKYIRGYSFSVLEFGFDIELYPVYMLIDSDIYNELNFELTFDKKITSVSDEKEFINSLNLVFESKRFHNIIGGLMKLASNEMSES